MLPGMWSIDDPGVSESPDYEREERDLRADLPISDPRRQAYEDEQSAAWWRANIGGEA